VAEEGHITRAAERLGMQQPPLSQQIRALEAELGVQLLRRLPRGVALTEAGRAFLEDARAVLARLGQAVETVRRTARGEQGRLSLGVPPTGPFHPFVPLAIRAFRDAYPMVSLAMEECLRVETMARLREGRMDAAFLRAPLTEAEGLSIHPLLQEPMVAALPSAHPLTRELAEGQAVALRRLAGETFIVYARQEGPALYEATLAACLAAGFSPRLGQEAPRITSALSLVAVGLGVALVPASMRRMTMDGVSYRDLKVGRGATAAPRAHLSVATRRGDPSPVVRHFAALVRREARRFAAAAG
jgi:DNA-binding transcriptional LysR family regulator